VAAVNSATDGPAAVNGVTVMSTRLRPITRFQVPTMLPSATTHGRKTPLLPGTTRSANAAGSTSERSW
jgi:hypothetical protein